MQFIQAKYYKNVNGRSINGIVIHTMEAPEKGTTAEEIANYFHSGITHPASAHYCIDNNSEVQCVEDRDIAYHAPGVNSTWLGFEHAGYARQSPAEWQDPYSQDLLKRSAALAAQKCIQYKIPVVWCSSADLLAGKRGFTSHVNVTNAYHQSTHTDPGPNFPIEQYLGYVRDGIAFLNGGGAPVPAPAPVNAPTAFFSYIHPTVRMGDSNEQIKHLQKMLGLADTGSFDAQTFNKVIAVQKFLGLPATGIVDQATWSKMHGVIRRGDTGDKVKELQLSLGLASDGVFGGDTETAVKSLQAAKRLTVDGIVGPDTWRALFLN